jgi:hypothetical protein
MNADMQKFSTAFDMLTSVQLAMQTAGAARQCRQSYVCEMATWSRCLLKIEHNLKTVVWNGK